VIDVRQTLINSPLLRLLLLLLLLVDW